MNSSLQERFATLAGRSPAQELELVQGTAKDYRALAAHHYRAARPATMMRIVALRDRRPTVVGRYLHRHDQTQTAAVLVESLPALSCRMRDWALDGRYGSWLAPRQRSAALNRDMRCISRVVVDPRWRGLGLAVRLVRHALAEPATMFTEALAAMGQVHPFFEKAGMMAYPRPRHAFDARLIDALACAHVSLADLVRPTVAYQCIARLPGPRRRWLMGELYRWYRQNGGGRAAKHSTDALEHLRMAQRRLLLEPIYYLHDNRG